tara:strand:+ start:136 stop:516 length:381 start_codon:yes stop_codon:yes gene_type:complete
MLDLEPFYNEVNVIENFNSIGPDGRSVYVLSALLLDTFYPILYTSLILGAYIKIFKNAKTLLFLPISAFSFDILENLQITRLNLNFPNINEFHVYLSSMTTSAKRIVITITLLILSYGIIKKRLKY